MSGIAKIHLGLLKLLCPNYIEKWRRLFAEYVKEDPVNHDGSFDTWMEYQLMPEKDCYEEAE